MDSVSTLPILGATEIDTDFNVNVHTDSSGRIMGGSGGHSDAAAGSKLSIIIGAPVPRPAAHRPRPRHLHLNAGQGH